MEPLNVGVLGATGLVGQHLVSRLAHHPWFRVAALAASERSQGRAYGDAVLWRLPSAIPRGPAALPVVRPLAEDLVGCDLLLSAFDAAVAEEVEPLLAAAGFAVISNSSTWRMAPDVPLIVPEVNLGQIDLAQRQSWAARAGLLVKNPNCAVAGLALVLAPLIKTFGVRRVVVTTLQALSGAGLHGPRGHEILDNVVPFIAGEEEKLETELNKIFGRPKASGAWSPAGLVVSAHCHRVPTLDGHLAAVSIELEAAADPAEVRQALIDFDGGLGGLALPSAPAPPIVVRDEPDRPQPRLDRDAGAGMAAVVGRIRSCPVLGVKLELLSHNLVRGAAGGTLLIAEALVAMGRLTRRSGA